MAMGGDPSATDRGPPRLPHAELRRARRDRARAAREAEAALLAKTLAKLAACEQQLADSKAELAAKFVAEAAVAPPTEEGSLFEQELVGRLALAAPILKANLAEARGDGDPVARPTVLAVARRNAAMHACAWDVATIREAKLPQLNRIQRGRPKPVKDSTPQQKGHTVEQPKHAALPQAKPHWHLPARLPHRPRPSRQQTSVTKTSRGTPTIATSLSACASSPSGSGPHNLDHTDSQEQARDEQSAPTQAPVRPLVFPRGGVRPRHPQCFD